MSAPVPDPFYLVRTHGEPMTMAHALRERIHEIEPGRSVFAITPLDQHLGDAFAENRLRTVLLGFFLRRPRSRWRAWVCTERSRIP